MIMLDSSYSSFRPCASILPRETFLALRGVYLLAYMRITKICLVDSGRWMALAVDESRWSRKGEQDEVDAWTCE